MEHDTPHSSPRHGNGNNLSILRTTAKPERWHTEQLLYLIHKSFLWLSWPLTMLGYVIYL